MRVVLQRVLNAEVMIDNESVGRIDKGYCLLVGITHSDDENVIKKVALKIADLRIFEDEMGKLNLSIKETGGKILSVSQFTLYADCHKGRRPSFTEAARPEQANPLYERFNEMLRQEGIEVETGRFGADMKVSIVNDGPVTIILDSDAL